MIANKYWAVTNSGARLMGAKHDLRKALNLPELNPDEVLEPLLIVLLDLHDRLLSQPDPAQQQT